MARYGTWAVLGRPLRCAEILRIEHQETVVDAVRKVKAAPSFAEWAAAHPEGAALVTAAMQASQETPDA